MIVFRTPKGWTGPKFVDGKPVPVEIVSPITPGRCFTNQSWA
jgi:phosphoketolase